MNKQELMENYTMEQLADKYLRLQERFTKYTEVIKEITDNLPEELKNETEFHLEIGRLQSEAEKYQKRIEDERNKHNCQICEYQNKIDELEKQINELKIENSELHCEIQAMNVFCEGMPEEPIEVAEMLIRANYTRNKGELEKKIDKAFGNSSDTFTENMYSVSELRQIAEHLLVYCNANGE